MAGSFRPRRRLFVVALLTTGLAFGSDWEWNLPPGFPAPPVPEGNPMSAEKVELGRRLFYDTRLSGEGNQACATCHRPELAFTDGKARAVGATGGLHPRGSMSLANVGYSASFGWDDPTVTTLEAQALVPMFNTEPVELGLEGRVDEVLDRFRADPDYRARFGRAFPASPRPIELANVVRALASFERTLISGGSPYDRLVFGGDMEALDEAAWAGMRLFFSERLSCSECHAGITFSGPMHDEPPLFHNTGLYNLDGAGGYPEADPGLVRHTGRGEDMGAFRAPTLRNVALTAPYMHDGSVATLGEVLEHYAAGGRDIPGGPHSGDGRASPRKSDRLTGFVLTAEERNALLAFLDALTDPVFVADPRFADPRSDARARLELK